MEIGKNYLKKPQRDPHLHSPNHVLADELASKLGDPRHFGFYLKTAQTTDHNVLRQILGGILEGKPSNPGALFAYLVKKYNREKDTSVGHSVWLLPEEPVSNQLQSIITTFSQTFDAPGFKPHVTLLGSLDQARHVDISELSELPALELEIQHPVTEDTFFRSITLPVVKNKFLLALRRKTKKLFQTEARGSFQPHLSLLYSNAPDQDKLAAIKEFIPPGRLPSSVLFNRVALVQTHGRVPEWKIKQIINLKHNHGI